nr:7-methyl-GTP pyrophosphatase-like isoform X4 [Nicotiana tomentosiformis]
MAPKNLSFKIILGSSSMARRKILADMGYDFTVMTADIDEKSIRKENAEELVVALAEAKIFFGYILPTSIGIEVAVYQGIIREKPSSKDEARQFIKSYSGGQATVVGSVVVTNLTKGIRKGAWERSEVYFHEIPDEVIDSLIEEGIILNVAGGLMLEHPLTLPFVDTVIGTADHVMGLPRSLTEKLIQEAL